MAQIDQKAFTERWIKHLVDSMDEHLDEKTRMVVMESCGRACARTGPVHVARECQGDLDRWLATLRKWHGGEEYVQQDGDVVRVICAECVCPAAKDHPEELSETYCICSLGWMKETFGAVVGKPVSVELSQSILRGAEKCEFVITL
jgi:predicted hydrocarbon binding protein